MSHKDKGWTASSMQVIIYAVDNKKEIANEQIIA
jgi:hypothetical protein